MDVSRRLFLTGLAGTGTYVTITAATPLKAARRELIKDSLATLPQYTGVKLNEFTPDLFKELLGSTFEVNDSGAPLTLRLTEVQLTEQPPGASPDPRMFSLHFRFVRGTALPQGSYLFRHTHLGSFVMFVVPSAKVRAPTYTAVFNRI